MAERRLTDTPRDSSLWDDEPLDELPRKVAPFIELGVTGVKRTAGYVDEEFLPALRGRKAVRVFREMSQNDSMVGSLLFAIDKLIREIDWKVLPADQSPENAQAAEFLESCMDDMSHSWDDFIGEVLTMITYGWSWHEIVFKRRIGPWEKDPRKKSKYDDGLIGLRKLPIRAQETMMRWVFDESGGIKGMIQMAPPKYTQTGIPIEKSLLFRTTVAKGNPEGMSLLRTAYRSWYFKKRLEEFEAIGVERDLAGMPVGKVPAEFLNAQPGTQQAKTVEAFRKMVRGVRRDENEGLIIPVEYDRDTKQPLYDFQLMSSSGTRQFDTNSIIQRYEQRILMSVLADFILVGHQAVGSYSLHTDKTGIFRAALNAITDSIAETLNRHLVPKLFEVNGWRLDQLPKFEPTNIDPPDLNQLASFISATAGAGMQWFPDPELEQFVRDIARLPEMSDETVDYKREMLMQDQAMQYADSQMNLLGLKQKAEMTAQGYSPEQAQMASEVTPPEVQEVQLGEQQAHMDQQAAHAAATAPPGEDPEQAAIREQQKAQMDEEGARASHKRDQEKAQASERSADAGHKRELQRMSVQEMMEQRKHQRDMERMKEQGKQQAKKPPPKKEKK